MESILKEIGVTNDCEDDILARILNQQSGPKETNKSQRQRLEFSTIANSIIEDIGIGGSDTLDQSLRNGFGGRKEGILVDTAGKKRGRDNIDNGRKDRSSNKALNALILNASMRAREIDANLDEAEPIEVVPSSRTARYLTSRTNKKLSSASSEKRTKHKSPVKPVKNKPLGNKEDKKKARVICPSCNRAFLFETNQQDELLSKHLASCQGMSRQRATRNPGISYAEKSGSEDEGEMDLVDGDDEEFQPDNETKGGEDGELMQEAEIFDTDDDDLVAEFSSTTKSRKKKLPKSQEEAEEAETVDEIEEVIIDLADDWEDNDYNFRLSKISPEYLEKMETSFGTTMHKYSWNNLYPYQQTGCEWLYHLFQDGLGGILADEMGLGKTAQVCAHFNELTLTKGTSFGSACPAFLVVCPATVLQHWLQEMHTWAPTVRTGILHSVSKTGKLLGALKADGMLKVIRNIRRSKLSSSVVVITTYESLRKHKEALTQVEWTAVCLDEGQKIRNPSADITITCKLLASYHRIILSGTPIQNSLRELWSLFDFVYPGRLGTLSVFEQNFATPIRAGGYANATKLQYEIAVRCAATLQGMVRPYLLRRKKDDLILTTQLPAKTEQVLFCQLSDKQRHVYREVLTSSEIQKVLTYKIPAFRAINTLRKLCNHPALVYQQGGIVWQIEKAREFEDGLKKRFRRSNLKKKLTMETIVAPVHYASPEVGELNDIPEDSNDNDDDPGLQALLSKEGSGTISWHDSGKMLVLSKILPIWKVEGHKVLLFSQTTTVLDLLQGMMDEMGFTYLRLDGSTDVARRPELIATFNQNPDIFIMLLTTRTGGVGISLTAANRVILFDPDWNPMTDIQARERAWRLGQKREVVIYRLITKGTIEEKIYHRQIFKLLISNRVLDSSKTKSIISKSHLRELFELKEDSDQYGNFRSGNSENLPSDSKVDMNHPSPFDNKATVGSIALKDLEIESYVESIEDSAKNERPAKNNSSSGKDYMLLKALFDGSAITDVYDHEYLEPGAKKVVSERNATLERKAAEITQQAVKSLQSSANCFQPVSDHNSLGGHFQNVHNSLSSSSLLESIRANQQSVKRSIEESSATSNPAPAQQRQETSNQSNPVFSVFSSPPSNSRNLPSSMDSGSRREAEPRGIGGHIRGRLLALFERDGDGLTTSFILSKFRDLGDQYAPLFKFILRDVARFEKNFWSKK